MGSRQPTGNLRGYGVGTGGELVGLASAVGRGVAAALWLAFGLWQAASGASMSPTIQKRIFRPPRVIYLSVTGAWAKLVIAFQYPSMNTSMYGPGAASAGTRKTIWNVTLPPAGIHPAGPQLSA
jgi:hypothetical protein